MPAPESQEVAIPSGFLSSQRVHGGFPYKEIRMAPRQIKMPVEQNADKEAEEVFSQRKRPESGRYLLQVDRQTKGSYKTSEAAISRARNQDGLPNRSSVDL
jgi:hypothetical protein